MVLDTATSMQADVRCLHPSGRVDLDPDLDPGDGTRHPGRVQRARA